MDAPGVRPLPTSISRCDDLREIAPGLWYPFRVIDDEFPGRRAHAPGTVADRLARRHDDRVGGPGTRVDDAIFGDVVVPAGTGVQVSDEQGNRVGVIRQEQAGVPSLTPAAYQKLLSDLKEKARHGRQRSGNQAALRTLESRIPLGSGQRPR